MLAKLTVLSQRADAVRSKLATLALSEKDITNAVDWVRCNRSADNQ